MVAARHRSPTACAGLSPLAPRAPSEVMCNGWLCDRAIMSDPVPRVSLATDPPSLRDASVSAFPGVIPGHSGFFLFFCFCRNKSCGKSSGNVKTVITPFKLAVLGRPISPSRYTARLEQADTSHHMERRETCCVAREPVPLPGSPARPGNGTLSPQQPPRPLGSRRNAGAAARGGVCCRHWESRGFRGSGCRAARELCRRQQA